MPQPVSRRAIERQVYPFRMELGSRNRPHNSRKAIETSQSIWHMSSVSEAQLLPSRKAMATGSVRRSLDCRATINIRAQPPWGGRRNQLRLRLTVHSAGRRLRTDHDLLCRFPRLDLVSSSRAATETGHRVSCPLVYLPLPAPMGICADARELPGNPWEPCRSRFPLVLSSVPLVFAQ